MDQTITNSIRTSRHERGGGWTLVIVGSGGLRTEELPAAGEILIGRDKDSCDVVLDHPRISRRHARLRLGESCLLEDLGSRNRTTVRGQPLEPDRAHCLEPGESFGIGPFSLVLVAVSGADVAASPSAIVVDDPAAAHPPAILVAVARSPLTVLIRGETGVGKELLADSMHRLSGRAGELVRLNCATFGESLLESELFGHERGAFTGAVAAKPGLLEVAAGGTVFLDEIGELSLPLQAKLLRAIEAREVLRVGATRPIAVDARFIVATNRDLQAETARGAFRLDLYYRLAGITLTIPPLAERSGRIISLAQTLVDAAAERAGLPAPRISLAAAARLQKHDWPGNVRELRNVMERAFLLGRGEEIRPEHILIDAPAPHTSARSAPSAEPNSDERRRIVAALQACAGNQTRAAKLLGISRATLATKILVHKIPRPRAR